MAPGARVVCAGACWAARTARTRDACGRFHRSEAALCIPGRGWVPCKGGAWYEAKAEPTTPALGLWAVLAVGEVPGRKGSLGRGVGTPGKGGRVPWGLGVRGPRRSGWEWEACPSGHCPATTCGHKKEVSDESRWAGHALCPALGPGEPPLRAWRGEARRGARCCASVGDSLSHGDWGFEF